MASMTAGSTPSEFGGIPGQYGNNDLLQVIKAGAVSEKADPLPPHLTRSSLTQTDPADPLSAPAYGVGGNRVA